MRPGVLWPSLMAWDVGMQLIAVTDIHHQHSRRFLKTLYKLYCDYVLMNPSYTLDMPITSVVPLLAVVMAVVSAVVMVVVIGCGGFVDVCLCHCAVALQAKVREV